MSELTDLLDEAASEPKMRFLDWLNSLDDEDRTAMLMYASSSALSTRKLHDIVASRGVAISREDLQRWRRERGLK